MDISRSSVSHDEHITNYPCPTRNHHIKHTVPSTDENNSTSPKPSCRELISKHKNVHSRQNVYAVIDHKSNQSQDSCHSDQENIPPCSSVNKNKSRHSYSIHSSRKPCDKRDLSDSSNSYVFVKRHQVEASADNTKLRGNSTNHMSTRSILTNKQSDVLTDWRKPANQNVRYHSANTNMTNSGDDSRAVSINDASTVDKILTNQNWSSSAGSKQLTSKREHSAVDNVMKRDILRPDHVDGSSDNHDQGDKTWDPSLSHITGSYNHHYVSSYCDLDASSPFQRSYSRISRSHIDSCDETFLSCNSHQLDDALHEPHDMSHDRSHDRSHDQSPWRPGLLAPQCSLVESDDSFIVGADRKEAVILDLVSCEQEFISTMQHGIQQFSRPLRHCVLSRLQYTTLFQNIEKVCIDACVCILYRKTRFIVNH